MHARVDVEKQNSENIVKLYITSKYKKAYLINLQYDISLILPSSSQVCVCFALILCVRCVIYVYNLLQKFSNLFIFLVMIVNMMVKVVFII